LMRKSIRVITNQQAETSQQPLLPQTLLFLFPLQRQQEIPFGVNVLLVELTKRVKKLVSQSDLVAFVGVEQTLKCPFGPQNIKLSASSGIIVLTKDPHADETICVQILCFMPDRIIKHIDVVVGKTKGYP